MKTIRSACTGLARGSVAWLAALMVALTAIAAPALAADDPPGRVGRVTDSQGQSWFFDTEGGEWVNLERNRPLTSGDRVAVDGAARLELRIGSTAVRLSGGSELEIIRLDDDRIDLFLHSGSAAVRVRSPEVAREVELATAEGRFSSRGAGYFRVDRRDDGSVGTAWSGDLHFEGDDSALDIPAGRSAELWREGERNATHYSWGEPQHDDFADWTARADREDDRATVPEYVSPEMTGAEDLNRYGSWENNAEYGPIWYPTTVVAGWAPYRYGHWAVVRPWGWTWVDYAPWGFAPFHYGRWLYFGGRWCWAPGYRVARPVYSPAMVAWVGGYPTYGRGPWPYVGWVPLAPREPYYPHYSAGGSYWRAVNAAQMNLFPQNTLRRPPSGTMMYANQGVAGAVSVVPGNAMVPRRPVAPVVAQVDPSVISSIANQPTRVHVPPPGVARPITVPGTAPGAARPGQGRATAPPTSPGPRPPGQPSPAVMGQAGTPGAPNAPPGGPRWTRVVPTPPITRPAAPPTTVRPVPPPGNAGGNASGNAAPPLQPRVGVPGRQYAPAAPPQTPPAPSVSPPAQPPAPAVRQPPPGTPHNAPTTPAPGRVDPGDPAGGSRRSGWLGPSPQARATPSPAAPAPMPPAARHSERVSPPHPQAAQAPAPRGPNQAPNAQARERVPEWQDHPSRAQMR
ncbi:MAG TPA: DUF6600 domain-containing protein [Burkholderiaceae bacterium]|nr:DUF6600 domain-containing protein [Burkholderiaceae bacterium]